jgi:hypothetical protein
LREELPKHGECPPATGIAAGIEALVRGARTYGPGNAAEASAAALVLSPPPRPTKAKPSTPPSPSEATVQSCEKKIRELLDIGPRTLRDFLRHPALAARGAEVRIALRRLTASGSIETSDGKTFRLVPPPPGSIPCPTCDALAGAPCCDKRGRPVQVTHAARVRTSGKTRPLPFG